MESVLSPHSGDAPTIILDSAVERSTKGESAVPPLCLQMTTHLWPYDVKNLVHSSSASTSMREYFVRGMTSAAVLRSSGRSPKLSISQLSDLSPASTRLSESGSDEAADNVVSVSMKQLRVSPTRSVPYLSLEVDQSSWYSCVGIWQSAKGSRGVRVRAGDTIRVGCSLLQVVLIDLGANRPSKDAADLDAGLFLDPTCQPGSPRCLPVRSASQASIDGQGGGDGDDQKPICRICFDDSSASPEDKLLTVCQCAGSVRYVHRKCLAAWVCGQLDVKRYPAGGGSFNVKEISCELCRHTYNMDVFKAVSLKAPTGPYIVLREMVSINGLPASMENPIASVPPPPVEEGGARLSIRPRTRVQPTASAEQLESIPSGSGAGAAEPGIAIGSMVGADLPTPHAGDHPGGLLLPGDLLNVPSSSLRDSSPARTNDVASITNPSGSMANQSGSMANQSGSMRNASAAGINVSSRPPELRRAPRRVFVVPFGSRKTVRIGRSKDNEVCMQDVSVSRAHASLRLGSEGGQKCALLYDCNSKFGSLVKSPEWSDNLPKRTAGVASGRSDANGRSDVDQQSESRRSGSSSSVDSSDGVSWQARTVKDSPVLSVSVFCPGDTVSEGQLTAPVTLQLGNLLMDIKLRKPYRVERWLPKRWLTPSGVWKLLGQADPSEETLRNVQNMNSVDPPAIIPPELAVGSVPPIQSESSSGSA